MHRPFRTLAVAVTLLGLAAMATPVHAAALTATVTDASGKPLADAVVYAEAAQRRAFSKPAAPAEIQQRDKQFVPQVTVVQTGTPILFPNHDTVRHHVYSFSSAKTFELKLYSGVPSAPIEFDKPGTVVVGCNIHDRMVGYIQIVDTPHFGKTDAAGKVRLDGMLAGKYLLKGWHPRLPANARPAEQAVDLQAAELSLTIRIDVTTPGG